MRSISVMLVHLLRVLGVVGRWAGRRGRLLLLLLLRRSGCGTKSNTKMMLDLLFLVVWPTEMMSHIHVPVVSVVITIIPSVVSGAVRALVRVEQAKLGAFLRRIGPFRRHLLSPSASEGVIFDSDGMRVIVVVTRANLLGIEVGLVAYGGATADSFKLTFLQ